jgi:hypothetical protein
VELYDWLLALHVIAAFGLAAGIVANWALVLATRAQVVGPEQAMRYGGIAGPMTGAMSGVALLLGIGLVLEVDAYEIFDFWIIAAIVLWAVAMVLGPKAGEAFREGPAGRKKGVTLLTANSVITTVILILMIWKPGA